MPDGISMDRIARLMLDEDIDFPEAIKRLAEELWPGRKDAEIVDLNRVRLSRLKREFGSDG
jgi:hypothetical protein